MTLSRFFVTGAILAFSSLIVVSEAQAGQKEDAKIHFDNGLSLMELEDFDGAMVEFQASIKKHPTKSAMFNLGMCLKALHRYPQALEAFQELLDKFGKKLDDEMRKETKANISSLGNMIARVSVKANVDGAKISIDGEEMGTTPILSPLVVGVGEHKVSISMDGYAAAERTITTSAAVNQVVEFNLEKTSSDAVSAPVVASTSSTLRSLRPVENSKAPPRPTGGIERTSATEELGPPPTPVIPFGPPPERSLGRKILGLGLGVQAIGLGLGLTIHYAAGLNTRLPEAGIAYFLSTAAVGGLVTWAYGHKSRVYDYPIWSAYIGSVVGAGLGYVGGYIIWSQAMGRDESVNLNDNSLFLITAVYIVAVFVQPIMQTVSYAVFKRLKQRYKNPPSQNVETKTASVSLLPPIVYPMKPMGRSGDSCLGIGLLAGTF